jgi:hypothetical protein
MARPLMPTSAMFLPQNCDQGQSSFAITLPPTKTRRRRRPCKTRVLVPLPAAILSRSKPHRDGLLKTQSTPAKNWGQNIRSDVRRAQQNLRTLHARRMLELLLRGRICVKLKVSRFNSAQRMLTVRNIRSNVTLGAWNVLGPRSLVGHRSLCVGTVKINNLYQPP